MHSKSDLFDTMAALVGIQYFVKHGLNTHLDTSNPHLTPQSTVFVSNILRSSLDSKSDHTIGSSFIDCDRLCKCLWERKW